MNEVVDAIGEDIDLLRGLPSETPRRRAVLVLVCSAALHVFLLLIAVQLPSLTSPEEPGRRVIIHRTPLYLPPDLLTQRAPNRAKVSKSIDLTSLLSPPSQQAQRSVRPAVKRPPEAPNAAQAKPVPAPPAILPEAPKVASATPPPGAPSGLPVNPPPPPPPTAKPVENPFQSVGSAPTVQNPTLKPKTDVQSAIQGLAQNRSGRNLVISDDNETPALPGVPGTPGANGSPHAAVELQSDPQGADFKAYLTQILAIVRGNWKRVIPESARMGTLRGRTTVEFIIDRDGKIPKIVIANSSGSEPLDRAAGAGLSMSDPLPPLPQDYRGFQVRLAFTFSYNVPAQ